MASAVAAAIDANRPAFTMHVAEAGLPLVDAAGKASPFSSMEAARSRIAKEVRKKKGLLGRPRGFAEGPSRNWARNYETPVS